MEYKTTVKNIYNNLLNNKRLKPIIRFGCVGCLNTIFDFGIFCILNSLFGVNYVISIFGRIENQYLRIK